MLFFWGVKAELRFILFFCCSQSLGLSQRKVTNFSDFCQVKKKRTFTAALGLLSLKNMPFRGVILSFFWQQVYEFFQSSSKRCKITETQQFLKHDCYMIWKMTQWNFCEHQTQTQTIEPIARNQQKPALAETENDLWAKNLIWEGSLMNEFLYFKRFHNAY